MPRFPSTRLCSLDVLRGFVVLTMVFVNYIPGMPGIPSWALHAGPEQDLITFVDVVFPAFLFMVGVAIPFSLGPRMESGSGRASSLLRIIPRVFGLLVLGLIFVNEGRYSAEATGMSQDLWTAVALLSAIVLWSGRPASPGPRRAHGIAQGAAAVALAAMLVAWRAKPGDGSPYMEPQWWGILGMIGWSYLVAGVAFLLVRGERTALMGLTALSACVYVGARHGQLGVLGYLDRWWSVGSFMGTTTTMVLAGTVAGSRMRLGRAGTARFLLWFGLGLLAAGWFLRPLHGYHKDAGTESWALASSGLAALLFLGFHVLLDRRGGGTSPPARWLAAVGRNALLAYVLPGLVGALFGMAGVDLIPYWGRGGAAGAANAAVVSVAVVSIAALATRLGITVRL